MNHQAISHNGPRPGRPDQAAPQLAAHGGAEALRHQRQAGQEQRGLGEPLKWFRTGFPYWILGIPNKKWVGLYRCLELFFFVFF